MLCLEKKLLALLFNICSSFSELLCDFKLVVFMMPYLLAENQESTWSTQKVSNIKLMLQVKVVFKLLSTVVFLSQHQTEFCLLFSLSALWSKLTK